MSEAAHDMTRVIVPKSDQINADDLIAGPLTITVREVQISSGQEQPVSIFFDGSDKAFRPCKSMSRVLVTGWGADAKAYVGRSMTLYRDPTVKWGGLEVGGIRISHMSHIARPMTMALTATKGSRKPYKVDPLSNGPATASGSPRTAETRSAAPKPPAADQAAPTLAERVTRAEAVLSACATAAKVDDAWTRMADLRTAAASEEDLLRRLSDAHQRAIDAFADETADEPTY